MHSFREAGWPGLVMTLCAVVATTTWSASGQVTNLTHRPDDIYIKALEGTAEISTDGARWIKTLTEQDLKPGDLVRTGPNSRLTIQWTESSVLTLGELSYQQIREPHKPGALPGLRLIQGILSFFHRNKPGLIEALTSGANADVEGTEFVLRVQTVNGVEETTLSVVDGRVRFFNTQGPGLIVTNLQEAVAAPGQAPRYTAGFIVNNRLQWCFYYPGVLDLDELPLSQQEQQALAVSLRAYRTGDLLVALQSYPQGRVPASDAERIYYAAVLLAVGQVEKTQAQLSALSPAQASDRLGRLAGALRQLIAAVKREDNPVTVAPELASELLAASYWQQSRATNMNSLEVARTLARRAVARSPAFGFGQVRLAELEFSFGETRHALDALEKGLALAPRNAEGIALQGFLYAAQNRVPKAIEAFRNALAVDPGLGNAWLGRGLCRIRQGDLRGGRVDLLVAAALEPQRSSLRSYLAKAYQETGDTTNAGKELKLAENLDPRDPTPWLYSALLNQQENRINQAVRDLEHSQELNDNRSVYRSRLLLDEDRAVRSANLAAIYRDAGMIDWSVLEASRAVSYDYANYSAHLFLANSFDALRDPNRINLRYETPAINEYLIANLLAPIQAGSLSPAISQQEYFRLFERDGFGLSSGTEYLSRGAWVESAAQYGVFGNTSYDAEAFYHSDPGQRLNNDLQERGFSAQIKQQVSPQDTIFFQASYYDAAGGDLAQYYDQANANLGLRVSEKQNPILLGGYHREWSPGLHTVLLASRLADTISVDNPAQRTFFIEPLSRAGPPPQPIIGGLPMSIPQTYRSSLEIYSVELQQIWETPEQTSVIGGRYQTGDFDTKNLETSPNISFPPIIALFPIGRPAADQDEKTDFQRLTFYAYHSHKILDGLQLTAGLAYDRLTFPENFRAAPIDGLNKTVDQIGPKAGVIWTPTDTTTLRAAYTRSLGGASFDQSFRLEPSTVAGFLNSFRSIIPESVGGAEAGAKFETFGVTLEQRSPIGTYLGVTAERLSSSVDRTIGVFVDHGPGQASPGSLEEHLEFAEKALTVTVDQLIYSHCSIGFRYRWSQSDLSDRFPDVPSVLPNNAPGSPFSSLHEFRSILQQVNLYAVFNHPAGWFAQIEGIWNGQSNRGFSPEEPETDFWQANVFAGYRFWRRRAEFTLGLLNLGDQDYRVEPLALFNDLPRSRTLLIRLRLNF